MAHLAGVVAGAVAVFGGTDIDDLVVLALLFLSARATGRPRPGHIVVGQYAGVIVLVVVSALAALGLVAVPERWVRLLGLVPLGIGLWGLVRLARREPEDEPPRMTTGGWLSVAGVTIANGADNLAVYTPLFRTLGLGDALVTVATFAVMVGVWCALGAWLGSHKRVVALVERSGHWLVPAVFVGVGVLVLTGL